MDKYDEAIEYLTEVKGREQRIRIQNAWDRPMDADGGCLFQFCTSSGICRFEGDLLCGCLTEVRHKGISAAMFEDEIKADTRIPQPQNITAADLPVFAEWQRKFDKEARNK